jgi:hypothetical protein
MIPRLSAEAPYCMVSQTVTATSLVSGSYTAIVWDNIIDDRWKMATAASSAIVVPRSGLYLCEGAVTKVATATANRFFVALQYSAAQWRGTSVQAIVSGNPTTGVSRVMKLLKGDSIALAAFHDEGVARLTAPAVENSPYFNVIFLRP